MFGFGIIGKLIIAGTVIVLLGSAVAWIRNDAVKDYRAQINIQTAKLRLEAAKEAEKIQAESEQEAAAHENEMAEKDQLLEAANMEIEKLETASKCVISRDTVRAINRGR